jgi:hypothetical protein
MLEVCYTTRGLPILPHFLVDTTRTAPPRDHPIRIRYRPPTRNTTNTAILSQLPSPPLCECRTQHGIDRWTARRIWRRDTLKRLNFSRHNGLTPALSLSLLVRLEGRRNEPFPLAWRADAAKRLGKIHRSLSLADGAQGPCKGRAPFYSKLRPTIDYHPDSQTNFCMLAIRPSSKEIETFCQCQAHDKGLADTYT